MNILHLTNDYSGSTVYKELFKVIDILEFNQTVYTAIKDSSSIDKNRIIFNRDDSKIIYSHVLNQTVDRVFYRRKIAKIVIDIESKIDLSNIGIIHAHTWYSDGGVALELYKKYSIPYIITVRNSDVNIFYRYLIHERGLGQEILKHAAKVVLISASYKKRVLKLSALKIIRKELHDKILVIPNGVDDFWVKHAFEKELRNRTTFNFLFVGRFTKNKNLVALQKAIIYLNNEMNGEIKLHIIGGGGNQQRKVMENIRLYPDIFYYHGTIHDKNKLLTIYRECDIFAMPSRHETFGLVYVEALLQGLPILYTMNEGIDGFYDEKIGEKIESFSHQDIKLALSKMINNYSSYSIPIEKIKRNHDWVSIARKYKNIYSSIEDGAKYRKLI